MNQIYTGAYWEGLNGVMTFTANGFKYFFTGNG